MKHMCGKHYFISRLYSALLFPILLHLVLSRMQYCLWIEVLPYYYFRLSSPSLPNLDFFCVKLSISFCGRASAQPQEMQFGKWVLPACLPGQGSGTRLNECAPYIQQKGAEKNELPPLCEGMRKYCTSLHTHTLIKSPSSAQKACMS